MVVGGNHFRNLICHLFSDGFATVPETISLGFSSHSRQAVTFPQGVGNWPGSLLCSEIQLNYFETT